MIVPLATVLAAFGGHESITFAFISSAYHLLNFLMLEQGWKVLINSETCAANLISEARDSHFLLESCGCLEETSGLKYCLK